MPRIPLRRTGRRSCGPVGATRVASHTIGACSGGRACSADVQQATPLPCQNWLADHPTTVGIAPMQGMKAKVDSEDPESGERLLKFWDCDEGVCKAVGVGHGGGITRAAIAPDQTFVVSVGSEGAIMVWLVPPEIVDRCQEPVA